MKAMKERRRESSLNVSLSKDDTDIFEKMKGIPALCWYFIQLLARFGEKGKQNF